MSKNFKTVTFLVAATALALTACVKSEDYEFKPQRLKYDLPINLQDILEKMDSFKTCNKEDSQIPELQEASKNEIQISSQIDFQDYEDTKCDGSIYKGHTNVTDIEDIVTISPDSQYGSNLNRVEISNLRTCTEYKATPAEDSMDEVEVKDSKGNITKVPVSLMGPTITKNGDVKLPLTAADFKVPFAVNVRDGNNVLVVKYLKCIQTKEPQNGNDKPECEKYEELGRKLVLLKASLKKNELPGVKKENVCTEKKNPSEEKPQ